MGTKNNPDKKSKSYIGLIIFIIIVAAAIYLFITTDIYAKIPGKDMTGSKYVGTWIPAGSGEHMFGEPFEEFTPAYVSLLTKEDVDKYRAEGIEDVRLDNNFMIIIDRIAFYDTGRALHKVFKNNYKATWEETELGVHYQPFIDGVYNPVTDYYAVESFNGKTPQDLGYSSDVFLVDISDIDPDDIEQIEEGTYCGFKIYAKE